MINIDEIDDRLVPWNTPKASKATKQKQQLAGAKAKVVKAELDNKKSRLAETKCNELGDAAKQSDEEATDLRETLMMKHDTIQTIMDVLSSNDYHGSCVAAAFRAVHFLTRHHKKHIQMFVDLNIIEIAKEALCRARPESACVIEWACGVLISVSWRIDDNRVKCGGGGGVEAVQSSNTTI